MPVGGQDLDTIARMLLDAEKYKAELKDVAKEIRAHKREQRDLKLVTEEHQKAVGENTKALNKNSKASGRLRATLTELKSGIDLVKGGFKAMFGTLDSVLSQGNRLNHMYAALPFSLDAAKEATKGFISESKLLEAANRGVALGIDLTSDKLANFATGAAVVARKMGTDTNQAISDLLLGIGRKSKLILDNLGIIVDVKSANEAWAKSNKTTAASMNEAQKAIAFQTAAIKELNRIAGDGNLTVETAGDKWLVLKNRISDATDELFRAIAESKSFGDVLGWLADGVSAVATSIKAMSGSLDLLSIKGMKAAQSMAAFMQTLPVIGAEFKSVGKLLKTMEKTPIFTIMSTWKEGLRIMDEGYKRGLRLSELQKRMAAKPKKKKKGKSETIDQILEELSWETEVQADIARIRKERQEKDKAAIIDFQEWKRERMAAADFEAEQLRLQRLQESLEAERQVRANFISSMESHAGISFIKKVLPDDDYQQFMDRLQSMGGTISGFVGEVADAAHGAFGAFASGFKQVITGAKSVGDAFKDSFHSWLSTWAEKMAMQALESTALALFSLASGNYAGAASYAGAAVLFGVAAAAAGGAAYATRPSNAKKASATSSRGLGGVSSAAPRGGGGDTLVFNINTIGAHEDELADIVMTGMTRARNRGQKAA